MTQVDPLLQSFCGIAGLTALGWWLSRRWVWGQKLGVTMLVLLLGVAVRNGLGWQPDARISSWVSGPLTSLAIAELLLAIRLKTLLQRARPLLLLFGVAVLATVVGVLVGAVALAQPLGDQRSELMGLYAATFSGGSLNLVSVGRILSPPDALLALATAADQIVFTLWFGVSLWLGRRHRLVVQPGPQSTSFMPFQPSMTLKAGGGWFSALVWGVAVVVLTHLLNQGLARIGLAAPSILVLTTVAVFMAQVPGVSSRQSCSGFGQFLIQPFFVVVGLSTPMAGVFSEGLWILGYAAIVVGMHAVVVLVLRRCQVPMAEVLVASQAAIGGPSTALALATGLERGDLAVAGVALGLLGYGLGTYLGVAMAALADGSFLQIAS